MFLLFYVNLTLLCKYASSSYSRVQNVNRKRVWPIPLFVQFGLICLLTVEEFISAMMLVYKVHFTTNKHYFNFMSNSGSAMRMKCFSYIQELLLHGMVRWYMILEAGCKPLYKIINSFSISWKKISFCQYIRCRPSLSLWTFECPYPFAVVWQAYLYIWCVWITTLCCHVRGDAGRNENCVCTKHLAFNVIFIGWCCVHR